MTMFEAAGWMVAQGISTALPQAPPAPAPERQQNPVGRPTCSNPANRAIEVDLRRYFDSGHPEWSRRGISAATCRYLGCGFLPPRGNGTSGSPLNSRLVFQIRVSEEMAPIFSRSS